MLPIKLRYYQDEAIQALYSYFGPNSGNPILALPTGTGKSIVIAAFVGGVVSRWPNQRILILTHRKELIDQNSRKLRQVWPQAPIGIYSAGLGEKVHWMPITFGGIQSVYNALDKFDQKFDLIIIDECHMISPSGLGRYGKVINHFKTINPKTKVIGLTATDYRLKQGMLTDETYTTDGDAIPALFTDVVYDLTDVAGFNRLVAEGYLSKPVCKPTHTQFDVSKVKVQAGEFNQKELAKAVDKDEITYKVVQETIYYGQDRNCWLVFGADIDHCNHIAGMMQQQNVECETVHSKLTDKQNDARIEAFKQGKLRALVNNDKLTTGFDHPPVDLIAMVRHTMSTSLWVQMVGRGTRPYDWNNPEQYIPGFEYTKQNCLVLDYARNTERLGPINNPNKPKGKSGVKGDMPVKICPSCGTYNFGAAKFCDECGHEFDFSNHLEATHDHNAVIFEEDEIIVTRFQVINQAFRRYQRDPNSIPFLMCTYMAIDENGNSKTIKENVLIEHTGYPRQLAEQWWAQRHRQACPLTVDEAIKFHPYFRTPKFIRVHMNLQYPKVLAAEF